LRRHGRGLRPRYRHRPRSQQRTRISTPLFLILLAEALAVAGEIEEALAALDNALATAAVSGAKGWSAEIHRSCGELTSQLPCPDLAKTEESFRTALAIAREQGTRAPDLKEAKRLLDELA
jgi:predicted ATPase